MDAKHKIEYVPIGQLRPTEYNPRQMTEKQAKDLEASMRKFGLVDPLIVNRHPDRMNVVIGGHQRLKVAKCIGGIDIVPVVYVELDEKQERELNLRLNKNLGEWDFDLLAENFEPCELEMVGFSEDELKNIFQMEMPGGEGGNGDPDAVPDLPVEPKSKMGDLYQLGRHRLLCGDSTKREDVEKLMGGEMAILMVTDPPYGIQYDPKWRDEKVNTNKEHNYKASGDKIRNDNNFNWEKAYQLFNGNIAYIWHATRYASEVSISIKKTGFNLLYLIIWNKDNHVLSRGDYHWKHELCWYAVRDGFNHNWQGARDQNTVWDIPVINSFANGKNATEWGLVGHSCQKPIECMLRPIINNSSIGESVYDPFGGSGSTLIACEKTNRRCFMMEIDPCYIDVIIARWEQFTGQQAVKL